MRGTFEDANENDRIVFRESMDADEIINTTKSVILDLNGFTITDNVSGKRLFHVSVPSFTVEGGAFGGNDIQQNSSGAGGLATGDNTNSMLWMVLMVIAATAAVDMGVYILNTHKR